MSTSWKIKKKKATRVGDVRFKASYFLPFRFGFPSPGAFNLPEEKVGGGGGGEEKEKKFAKNKVCAGERRESAVEGTTGSPGVTAGTSDPKDSAGSWSRHTHTHTHTTRLLFVPGSSFFSLARSLFCSLLSTPPPGRLSKSCTPPVPPAGGWETPGA